MQFWSDGAKTVIYDDRGISVYKGIEGVSIRTLRGEPANPNPRSPLGSAADRVLAVRESFIIAGGLGEVPFLLPLEPGARSRIWDRKLHAAATLSDEALFLIVSEDVESETPRRAVAADVGADGSYTELYEIPFPVLLPVETDLAPWSKSSPGDEEIPAEFSAGPFLLTVNQFGLALVDVKLGVCALLRPQSRQFEFALRFPVVKGAALSAAATAQGLLTVVNGEKKRSLITHFSANGEVLGRCEKIERSAALSVSTPAVVSTAEAVVINATRDDLLTGLSLPALEELYSQKLPAGDVALPQRVSVINENWFYSCTNRAACCYQREPADGRWSGVSFEKIKPAAIEQEDVVEGKSAVQARVEPPTLKFWSAKMGSSIELSLVLTNSGGKASGLRAELSGDAVKSGLIKPRQIVCGDLKATLESGADRFVGELPLQIDAAKTKATKKVSITPWSSPPIVLVCDAKSAGNAMLMVRMTTADGSSAACGKLVSIAAR